MISAGKGVLLVTVTTTMPLTPAAFAPAVCSSTILTNPAVSVSGVPQGFMSGGGLSHEPPDTLNPILTDVVAIENGTNRFAPSAQTFIASSEVISATAGYGEESSADSPKQGDRRPSIFELGRSTEDLMRDRANIEVIANLVPKEISERIAAAVKRRANRDMLRHPVRALQESIVAGDIAIRAVLSRVVSGEARGNDPTDENRLADNSLAGQIRWSVARIWVNSIAHAINNGQTPILILSKDGFPTLPEHLTVHRSWRGVLMQECAMRITEMEANELLAAFNVHLRMALEHGLAHHINLIDNISLRRDGKDLVAEQKTAK